MKKYFYTNGKEKQGPFTFKEMEGKSINTNTLIWLEGLDDWVPASELQEMIPILELHPPPIKSYDANSKSPDMLSISEKESSFDKESNTKHEPKKASEGWIIAGFIFSLLGGYLGMVMGFNYAFGKYKKETKQLGWIMVIIGFLSGIVWRSL